MRIVTHPNLALRTTAKKVDGMGKRELKLLRRMLKIMRKHHAIGLAAPQIGYPLRLVVVEVDGVTVALGNPTILEHVGSETMAEGCLSIPGGRVVLSRPTQIRVTGIDSDDREVELRFDGLAARAVQHEIDHLNGVLIIDYAPMVSNEVPDSRASVS